MSSSDWSTYLQLGLTCFIAASAAVAAFGAWYGALETKRAARGQLTSSILDTYADSEMLKGMSELRTWWDEMSEKTQNPAALFVQILSSPGHMNHDRVMNLNQNRRAFSHYMHKIYKLKASNYVDNNFVFAVTNEFMVSFYFELIEHLENAINKNYSTAPFEFFHQLYPNLKREPPSSLSA